MATPTPTIRPIPTTFDSCVAEREPAGEPRAQGRSDPDAWGLQALWRAYLACRKGKRNTRDAQQYEAHLLDGLVQARDALTSASWRPSPLLCFVVRQPKLREIHAAPFADRVVHHLLAERLARLYEPIFIHDSYANRKGKGKGTVAQFPWLAQVFSNAATPPGAGPLHPAWQPASISGVASQYRYFAQQHPQACVLMQVGKYWLLPLSAGPAHAALGGALLVHQPGLGQCLAWRTRHVPRLRQRLKQRGTAHVLVAQDGHCATGFKRRVLWLAWYPRAQATHPSPDFSSSMSDRGSV